MRAENRFHQCLKQRILFFLNEFLVAEWIVN